MLGLVCMFDKKGMKKGVSSIAKFDLKKVTEAALFNLDYTLDCIKYCIKNNLNYRVSSSVIPFIDIWDWKKNPQIIIKLEEIRSLSCYLRLTIHPDQYVVLNSNSDLVIENSIKILNYQAELCKYMGIKDMVIHIGKKSDSEKFELVFETLSPELKSLIRVENCHYYKVDEVLKLCKTLHIPMVLDVHHARVTNSENYDIDEIKKTWKKERPLAHISSGRDYITDRAHSDYILKEDVKDFLWLFKDFDVEIEAKKKEKAVEKVDEILR
ncbi:MAG: hypothetical protein RR682_04545 [Cetobacterium sp.]|uniref:hypothetical protein n=1 Tax=Cetobacterium sp. TaxID=2071632 RepID=UPI002FCBD235